VRVTRVWHDSSFRLSRSFLIVFVRQGHCSPSP
jgi:hypothetical protein